MADNRRANAKRNERNVCQIYQLFVDQIRRGRGLTRSQCRREGAEQEGLERVARELRFARSH
jgi:hypothetical protein